MASKKYTFSTLPEDKRWLLKDSSYLAWVALNSFDSGEISEEEFHRYMTEAGFEKDGHSYSQSDLKGLSGVVHELAGSTVANLTGERDVVENEKNRQFQSDEADEARAWQAEQARQEREWNSIGAQMERAASVGVNPISVAMSNGGINASTPTSIPGTPAVPMGSSGVVHSGALDIASTIFNGIGTFAEQRLKQSQADDIVAMRQYNIAEKIANTDHLRQLCDGVGLSNVAQQIQNSWLDRLNQATYDSAMGAAAKSHASAQLDLQQIESVKQDMALCLKRFNATLPLEVQLMESELDLNNASVQQIYTEISMRHLQAIEQESRNRQAASEAESAEVAADVAKATYEDAISSFHNDMVRGAAEAGISLYDYQYYGTSFNGLFDAIGKSERVKWNILSGKKKGFNSSSNIKGLGQ